jgi:hypothetical protein
MRLVYQVQTSGHNIEDHSRTVAGVIPFLPEATRRRADLQKRADREDVFKMISGRGVRHREEFKSKLIIH